ncbi:hypothetical protein ACVOMS_31620 [Bradyrhizobium guangxiense]
MIRAAVTSITGANTISAALAPMRSRMRFKARSFQDSGARRSSAVRVWPVSCSG